MKTIKFNDFKTVLAVCAGVLMLTFVAYRYIPGLGKPIAKPYSTEEQSRLLQEADLQENSPAEGDAADEPLALPQPTSAAFVGSDVLRGLGPNWTFVGQQDQKMLSMSYVAGTAPDRESVVRLVADKGVGLVIEESRIADKKMLEEALKSKDVAKTTVAGKTAYLIPMGGLAGGTALLLVGSTSVLILQDPNAANWPEKLHPEIEMYVRTVDVP